MGCGVIGFREGVLKDLSSDVCFVSAVGDKDGFTANLAKAAAGELCSKELSAKAITIGRKRTWDDVAKDTASAIERLRGNFPLVR